MNIVTPRPAELTSKTQVLRTGTLGLYDPADNDWHLLTANEGLEYDGVPIPNGLYVDGQLALKASKAANETITGNWIYTGNLRLPNGALITPAGAGSIYRVNDSIRYLDSLSSQRTLLNAEANLSDLDDPATARDNLGLGSVENAAASGLYVALTGDQSVAGAKTFTSPLTVDVSVAGTGIALTSATNPYFQLIRGGVERLRLEAVGAIGTIGGSGNGLVLQASAGTSAGLSFTGAGPATFTHNLTVQSSLAGSVGVRALTLEGNRPEIYFKNTVASTSSVICGYDNYIFFARTNSSGTFQNYAAAIRVDTSQVAVGHAVPGNAILNVKVPSASPTATAGLFQAAASQTGNLIETANSAGAVEFCVKPGGNVQLGPNATPSLFKADASGLTLRNGADTGYMQFIAGSMRSAGSIWVGGTNGTNVHIYGTADGVMELYNNPETGFTRIAFGGAGTSHPALSVSSTQLNATLANGSAWTSFGANQVQLGSASGPRITTDGTSANLRNSADTAYTALNLSNIRATGFIWLGGASANNVHLYGTGSGILELYNANETGFDRITFGVGSSSTAGPALARSGTQLQCTLANASAWTSFGAGDIELGSSTGPIMNTTGSQVRFRNSTNTAYANGEMATCYSAALAFGGAGLNNVWMYGPGDGIITLYNNAQTGFSRIEIGGRGPTFPGISRSGANLSFVLADGSGPTSINAANGTFSGQIVQVPPSTATLSVNGQLAIEMTSNTEGNVVYRGSDGVTRRIALGGGGGSGVSASEAAYYAIALGGS